MLRLSCFYRTSTDRLAGVLQVEVFTANAMIYAAMKWALQGVTLCQVADRASSVCDEQVILSSHAILSLDCHTLATHC